MSRLELINRVKQKIDEVTLQDAPIVSVGLVNTNPTDVLISGMLDESAKDVTTLCNKDKLERKTAVVSATISGEVGEITLPVDFARLGELKMSDWERSVYEFASPIEEAKQSNRYSRGGRCKPVAVRCGNKASLYSTNGSVSLFSYIPFVVAEEMPKHLLSSVEWICAGKVMLSLGIAGSEQAYENAKTMML